MGTLKNKIIDVSTSKKAIKAFKTLEMFNQKMTKHCGDMLSKGVVARTSSYINLSTDSEDWAYAMIEEPHLHHDIIQPSELKKILGREMLKDGDVIIIEGSKPEKTRWIASIRSVSYYGDAGLKFSTESAIGLNHTAHRVGANFAGKFKRFATLQESQDLEACMFKNKNAYLKKEMGSNFEEWANAYFAKNGPHVNKLICKHEACEDFRFKHPLYNWRMQMFTNALQAFCKLNNYELNPKKYWTSVHNQVILGKSPVRSIQNNGTWIPTGSFKVSQMLYISTDNIENKPFKCVNHHSFGGPFFKEVIPSLIGLPPFIDVLMAQMQINRKKLAEEINKLDSRHLEQLETIPPFLKGRSLTKIHIDEVFSDRVFSKALEKLLADQIKGNSILEPQLGDLCRFWNTNERFPKGQRVGILTQKKCDALMKMSFQENEKQWYEYATPITIEEGQKIYNIKQTK